MAKAFAASGVPAYTNRAGSMWTTFFQKGPVTDYASAKRSDTRRYAKYFHGLLERGVYIAPSQYEAGFVSLAHTKRDLDRTVAAAKAALASL
jgi:glutamate-1-semialdehyde 2,1-aminomutase